MRLTLPQFLKSGTWFRSWRKPIKRHVVLVTGLSGAGKSTALRTLEDLGYEAVDNPPQRLLEMLVAESGPPLAICIDARSRDFSVEKILALVKHWRDEADIKFSLLYLDCSDEVLQRRFTETRRKHPLAMDRTVADGIARERPLLSPLQDKADLVINTTDFNAADQRRILNQQYAIGQNELFIQVLSFSYRRGLPRDADMLLDARFLQNPFYVDALKGMSGEEKEVQDYIANDPDFAGFISHVEQLLKPLLPRYQHEGKQYFTLAVGCTGGRHRSVFVAEKLAGFLRGAGYNVSLQHRDSEEHSA